MIFFTGFPKEGIGFLKELEMNNNREWFGQNKTRYQETVETPTKEFVAVMTAKMRPLIGGTVRAKIFRIYRDVRFSRDKTPYNPLIKIAFAPAAKMEKKGCSPPMYFFRLHGDMLALGAGVYEFNDSRTLGIYRKHVADDVKGPKLTKILKRFGQGGLWINEPHYKRVPAGFDKNHPREDLLRHYGLYALIEAPVASQLYTEKAIDFCLKKYKDLRPLFNWLDSI